MGLYIKLAIRNIKQARRRTMLLGTAIALVTGLLVLMLSLSQGIHATMVKNITSVASGHVNIAGFYKNKPTDQWPMITGVSKIRQLAEENTPGLDYIVDRHRAWAKVVSAKQSFWVSPSGVDIATEPELFNVLKLAKESEYKDGGRDEVVGDLSRLKDRNTALIFAAQAKRLKVEVGDYLTITAPTSSGRTNTIDVTVVAVGKDLGFMTNWSIFLPKSDVQELYSTNPDVSSVVMIYLKDPEKAADVMANLREVYEQEGYRLMDHDPKPFFMKFETVAGEDWTGQKLDLTTWNDEISMMEGILAALDTLTFVLMLVLSIVIMIGIMNAMWISVKKRTKEVGMVRAIGMRRGQVLKMFVAEVLTLGLLSSFLGVVLSAGFAILLDAANIAIDSSAVRILLMSDKLNLVVVPAHLFWTVFGATLVAGVSALWPAYRASKLEPMTAIGHTG